MKTFVFNLIHRNINSYLILVSFDLIDLFTKVVQFHLMLCFHLCQQLEIIVEFVC